MHYLQKKQQELISNKIVEFSFALKKYLNSTVSYVHCTALLWIPLSGFGPIILCGISEYCHFSYLVFSSFLFLPVVELLTVFVL